MLWNMANKWSLMLCVELPQGSAERDKWAGLHFSLLIGKIKHQYIKFCLLIKFSHMRSLIGAFSLANMSFHFPEMLPLAWRGQRGWLGSEWHPGSLHMASSSGRAGVPCRPPLCAPLWVPHPSGKQAVAAEVEPLSSTNVLGYSEDCKFPSCLSSVWKDLRWETACPFIFKAWEVSGLRGNRLFGLKKTIRLGWLNTGLSYPPKKN